MRAQIHWSADRTTFQLKLIPSTREESDALHALYMGGSIMALDIGEKDWYSLVLGTSPERGGIAPHGGHGGGGRKTTRCWCPSCDWELDVDEGQSCNRFECPTCGTRLIGE